VNGPINPFAWLPELFGDDVGTTKDVNASIHVKPDAPVVPILKSDGTIPICGDYRGGQICTC